VKTRTFIFIRYLNEEIKNKNYKTKNKKKMKKLDKCTNNNVILPSIKQTIQIKAQAAPRGHRLKDQNANLQKKIEKKQEITNQNEKKKIVTFKINTNFPILLLYIYTVD